MKKLLLFLALFSPAMATIGVFKSTDLATKNQITEDLVIGPARLLSLNTGTLNVSAGTFILAVNQVGWNKVDKTGSNLTDLVTRTFASLQSIPTTAAGYGITNGTNIDTWGTKTVPTGTVLGTSDVQTVTGKSIDASQLTGTVATARLYTTAAGYNITNGAAIDALGAVASNGLLQRTAANTYSAATIGTATGITWSAGTLSLSAIPNSSLANTGVTIGTTTIALGGTSLTLAGLTSVGATTFSGALTGNASTATALATPRAINGVNFDGTVAITVAAAAGTLTGTTLNATVTASSLTSLGTIASLTATTGTIGGVTHITNAIGGVVSITGNGSGSLALNGGTAGDVNITPGTGGQVSSIATISNFGGNALASVTINLNSATSSTRLIGWLTAASYRWKMGANNSTESGSNIGSNFFLNAYDDSGTLIDVPVSVGRASGSGIALGRPTTIGTGSGNALLTMNGGSAQTTGVLFQQGGAEVGRITFPAGTAMVFATGSNVTALSISGTTQAATFASSVVIATTLNVQGTNVTVGGNAVSSPFVIVNGAAASLRGLAFRTAGVDRWWINASSAAESGSNAGSTFLLQAYDDAGASIDNPVAIVRAAGGTMTLTRPVQMLAGSAIGSSAPVATTALYITYGLSGNAAFGINNIAGWTATGNSQTFTSYSYSGAGLTLAAFTGATYKNINLGNPTIVSGTLALSYQLYIGQAATATTAYGIYQNGTDPNFFSGSIQATNFTAGAANIIQWNGRSAFQSPSDGVLLISNNAATDFTRLQFGGTTASFPSLKRSTTTLQARLADDSGYAGITAGAGIFNGNISTTGTLNIDPGSGTSNASLNLVARSTGTALNGQIVTSTVGQVTIAADGTNQDVVGQPTGTGTLRSTTGFKSNTPVGGVAATYWKLGAVRTSVALVVSTTTGVQLDVGGTLYTLAVLTTNP